MEHRKGWHNQTLDTLESIVKIKPAGAHGSHLTEKVLKLRNLKLELFTVEDLRIMIGQQEGLVYLIPLAINYLKEDLLAEGDFYPGDLLSNVLKIDPVFWKINKELWLEVDNLIKHRLQELDKKMISAKVFYNPITS